MADPSPDDIRDPGLTPFNVPGIPPGGGFAGLSQTVLGSPPSGADGAAPLVPPQSRGLLPVGRPPTPSLAAALPELYKPKPAIIPEPPKAEYRDPLMALGQPLSLVALLGSLFVRQPATAAMNSMAAAMEAQRKGDQQKYENHYKEYVQQIAKVNAEQAHEREMYEESYANKKLSFDERMAEMKMTAARRKDAVMAATLNAGGGDAGSILEARLRAGKPVTEAEIKVAAIDDMMKKDKTLTLSQAASQYERDKQGGKEEAKEEHKTAKPLSMTQLNAQDVGARTKRIMDEQPGISEDAARIRAMDEFNAAKKAPPGAAWATLDPTIQNVVTAFPEAREKLASDTYKLPPARQANLIAGLRVIKENDRVAQYVADNPDAVGVLPMIYNRYHSTLVTKPRIEFATPEEAAAETAKIADTQAQDIRSLGGKMILPDGRKLDPGLAERAAILNKMLIQTGLSDAAQMSASGRGGTIYLDKLMSEKIYNQATNPYVLLNFLADRSAPAAMRWKELNDHIDLASPQAPADYRSKLLTPGGIESFLAKAYPQKGAPPKEVTEEEYNALPRGTQYLYKGKIMVKQ